VIRLIACTILAALLPAAAVSAGRTWVAEYIWDRAPAPELNAYTYFRKEVTLLGTASSATAYITADSAYQLFVNGVFVGRGPVRSDLSVQFYDTYDLRPFLQPGENVIAVIVHFFGVGNERYVLGRGALLFESEIVAAGTAPLLVKSDASWKTLRSAAWDPSSPRENDSNGWLEIFDGRNEPLNWMLAGFNASSWGTPFIIGVPPRAPWQSLAPRDIPFMYERDLRAVAVGVGEVTRQQPANPWFPIQIQQEFVGPASTVSIVNPNYLVNGTGAATRVTTPAANRDAIIRLDFGRIIAGFPYIDVQGPAGATIDVAFSEFLEQQQIVVLRSPLRFADFNSLPMFTADRVILRSGRMRWQRFFFNSFRYVQLTIRNATQPVTIRAAGAVFTSYPYVSRGRFRSSDVQLNRIWDVGAYTAQLSTYDVYMDCPWREKGQWMDMVTPLINYYAFGDQAISARYLRSTARGQSAQGRMFFPYPSWFSIELPDQAMWWGMHLWLYYLYFGDVTLLQELYPVIAAENKWLQQHLSPRGLIHADWEWDGIRPLWPWIDHGHRWGLNRPGEKAGEMAALDALYYKYLRDAASIAQVLGKSADASTYLNQAAKLKNDFNAAYQDASAGYYWDDPSHTIKGEQASVLAVLYDLAPADQWTRILNNVMDADYHVGMSSPHFYFWVLDALSKAGMHDKAMGAIRTRWGGMLAKGATTWWEYWNFDTDLFGRPWSPFPFHNLSMVHGYSGAPTYFLSSTVLGVRPTAAGFSKFTVTPETTGLTSAEGAVPTPAGPIFVAWTRTTQPALSLSLAVPQTTTGTVAMPRLPLDEIYVNGTAVWRRGSLPVSIPGLRVLGASGNRILLEVQPGSWKVASR
jgi:hypothetical protein